MARPKKVKTKVVRTIKKTATSKLAVKKTKKVVKKAVKKAKKVLPLPKGYHNVIPSLVIDNAAKAIAFYKKVFGAKEIVRFDMSKNMIAYAEIKIGDSHIMLSDPCPIKGTKSIATIGGSPISIYLYVKNVDATLKTAVSAGAKVMRSAEDMFYGDRSAMFEDPFGYHWCIGTHIEDVTPAQLRKRVTKLFGDKK